MKKSFLFLIISVFSISLCAQEANTVNKKTLTSKNGTVAIDITFNADNTCSIVFRSGLPRKTEVTEEYKPMYTSPWYTGGSHSNIDYGVTGFAYGDNDTDKTDTTITKIGEDKITNCNKDNFVVQMCTAIYHLPKKDIASHMMSGMAFPASSYAGYKKAIEEDKAECNES
ncbi:MAG: hypothetical protein NTY22_08100, partial [Proteobacteria bacterium]|nr:hypothetical protein [Pseudomonadota bacterium]